MTATIESRLAEAKKLAAQAVLRFLDHHPDADPEVVMHDVIASIGHTVVANARRHMWVGEAGIIVEAVAAAARVDTCRVLGLTREAPYPLVRFIVCHMLRDRGHSLNAIGAALGGRDHTTILHGLRVIKRKLARFDCEVLSILRAATKLATEAGCEVSPVIAATAAVERASLAIPGWADKAREMRRRGATLKSLAKIHDTTPEAVRAAVGEALHQ